MHNHYIQIIFVIVEEFDSLPWSAQMKSHNTRVNLSHRNRPHSIASTMVNGQVSLVLTALLTCIGFIVPTIS